MGYLLGNYIHLTAKNYQAYGTKEWKDTTSEEVTAKLFETHLNNIHEAAKKFSIHNLKQIEKNYNKLNQQQYEQFTKILNSDNISTYLKKTLLEELVRRLSPKTTPWTEEQIQEIVSHLHWDTSTQTFYYTGNKLQIKTENKIHLSNLGDAKSFRYINTIMTRSQRMIQEIASHPTLDKEHKIDFVNQIKEEIINPIKKVDGYQKRSKAQLKKLASKSHKWLGMIDTKQGEEYFNKLLKIRSTINGIDNLNSNLQWKFSELLGNMIGQQSAQMGYQKIIDVLTSSLSSKGTHATKKNIIGVSLTGRINQELLKQEKVSLQENGSYITDDGINQVQYFFKGMGDGRFQKADVEFVINSTTKEKIGISLKNTDISSYINKQSQSLTKDFISLQDSSSLMLYLAGIQQNYQDMGNHYLNIFAEHKEPRDEKIDNTILSSAIESFKTNLLFSALSGANQLREGGQANVLAIYDKAEINHIKQVKFFDIYKLVTQGVQGAQFSPQINTIVLSNVKEEDKNLSKRQNASNRITKLLLAAKNQQVSVYLSKNYLMSIYK